MRIKRFLKRRYIVPAVIVLAPIAIALFIFIGGGIVMLLWNWLLPPLFEWPRITVWQGFGLLVLCRILFGGFGRGGGGGGGGHRPKHITQEEREQFRRRMKERFCGTSSETQTS